MLFGFLILEKIRDKFYYSSLVCYDEFKSSCWEIQDSARLTLTVLLMQSKLLECFLNNQLTLLSS